MKITLKRAALRCAAVLAVTGAVASTMSLSASADPKQYNAFVGVGSDTTQDVMNALAGNSNGINYAPAQTSVATGQRQLISFDATGTTCITPRTSGVAMNRPNGSSQGRRALSRSLDNGGYGTATCGGPINNAGLVDFARSSSGPSGATTELTYVPFGLDAVSFAYYRADGSPVTTLSRAQLTSLFTTGAQTISGVRVLPCGIQTGSGTYGFWNTVTTASTGAEATATAECNNLLGADVRAQENDGLDLKARGDAADAAVNGTQVVIGFSAGAFIAKSNGVAEPAPPTGVGIGSISNDGAGNNLGSPVVGAAAPLSPNAAFYGNATFGRSVYNVLPTSKIDSAFGNTDLKAMFKGAGSAVCAQTSTIETFGFLVSPNCGSTAIKGSYVSGQL